MNTNTFRAFAVSIPYNICKVCEALYFLILHRLSCPADLFYLAFFFERREIPSRSCIRDMQKLFHFVVGDFIFGGEQLHYLVSLLALAVLSGNAGFV